MRSTSITGTILSSSAGVFIAPGFSGIANFLFSIPVAVTPGTTYYIQTVIQSGNPGIGSFVTGAGYSGGTEILSGKPITDRNLWFREGTVVPEPSSVLLALLGGGVLAWRCRKR